MAAARPRSAAGVTPSTTMSNGRSRSSGGPFPPQPVDDRRQDLGAARRLAVRTLGLDEDPVPAGRAPHRSLVRPRAHDPDRDPRPLDRASGGRSSARTGSARPSNPNGSPDSRPSRIARVSSSRSARSRAGVGSPTLPKPASSSVPSPTGSTRRPPDSTSRETASRASFHGRRRAGANTIAPSLTRSRPHRHRREHDPRVVHRVRADRDRVEREHAVPAGVLGLRREVGRQPRVAGREHDAVAHAEMIAALASRRDGTGRRSPETSEGGSDARRRRGLHRGGSGRVRGARASPGRVAHAWLR